MTNLFRTRDYRSYLNAKIRENEAVYGYKTLLARAAGCRNSFLSQVLGGMHELSPEHALGLAEYWGLSAAERDQFILLVQYARAGTPALRRYYEGQLEEKAGQHERDWLRGNAREVPDDAKSLFYSSWHYTAIHDLTTFPRGQTAEAIARRLELPRELVEESLRALARMGLVERREKGWSATVQEVIVPPGTHYGALHVAHWTQRAAQDAWRKDRPLESFHKCWVFGVSRADYAKVRELVLDAVRKAQKLIPRSERDELACLNLNLFVV